MSEIWENKDLDIFLYVIHNTSVEFYECVGYELNENMNRLEGAYRIDYERMDEAFKEVFIDKSVGADVALYVTTCISSYITDKYEESVVERAINAYEREYIEGISIDMSVKEYIEGRVAWERV